jgi:phage tail protein X
MYKHFRNQSTFILKPGSSKNWGNDVVYGAVFLCKDFDFYKQIFDAYHTCSMSTMLKNHPLDTHHRIITDVTTINFNTLDELARLMYQEGTSIETITYVANPNHPKIKQRFATTKSYRITDGIDAANFKKLFWEETHETRNVAE